MDSDFGKRSLMIKHTIRTATIKFLLPNFYFDIISMVDIISKTKSNCCFFKYFPEDESS